MYCLLSISLIAPRFGAQAFVSTSSSTGRPSVHRRSAHSLNTAFEWLADDRENQQSAYSSLTWLDAAELKPDSADKEFDVEMPLYPIGATYLPSKTTHFLNNMEPRNVQMALDLGRLRVDRKFCVVLSATDTGRIASVGTVMEVVDIEMQRVEKDTIRKIQVTCRPEATVDIVSIVNPEAASWESRIRKLPEYLKANVKYRKDTAQVDGNDVLVTSILEDYNIVREFYLSGVGSDNLPPYAVENLRESLPAWTSCNFDTETGFWFSLEQWQTLCNTVRDQQQSILSTNRNEVMVAAAAAKGGILTLPIHASDLPPEVRRQLQDMEVEAQEDFTEMGMDPCLDFQVLLSLPSYPEKLQLLSTMITRERQRLEMLQQQVPSAPVPRDFQEQPRAGAWFDDSAWEKPPEIGDAIDEVVSAEESMAFNSTQCQ